MAEPLIDLEEARRRVLDAVRPLDGEPVELGDALGRVLAAEVVAPENVPGFDNSAMDGFAVRAADTAGAAEQNPVTLPLRGESRAGRPAAWPLEPGTALRISTGAMLPAGADAVVPIEQARENGDAVEVLEASAVGRHVRRAGEDVRAGTRVMAPGLRVGPAELGVAASTGAVALTCARRPRVAVLTTGDELRSPGADLPPGGVRDTNAWSVPAQAREAGAAITLVETAPDERRATLEAIERGLGGDLLAICGGVSVGPHDHVKPALAELGVTEVFSRVALRPGKPVWFGVHDRGPARTLVLGLPGNPVSAMVTFHLFARPALAAMTGLDPDLTRVTATLDADYGKPPGRTHAVRCRLEIREDGWHATPTKEQGSHVLTSMLDARGLALIEADRGDVTAGERVTVELLHMA